MSDALIVSAALAIPRNELVVRASRSGGPGGQHVNTSSTRIEITWNVVESPAIDEGQRAQLLERLANRIDTAGNIRVVASASRSQQRNRDEAEERLATLIGRALRPRRKRIATRPPRGAKEARLQAKRRQSDKKRHRRGPSTDE